ARGDSNPDLHGLNVPRLPVAPRADNQRWSLWVGSNHPLPGEGPGMLRSHYRGGMAGSAYGYRTRPSALATQDASSTPRPNRLPSLGCQRTHSHRPTRVGDSARIRTWIHEIWRLGCSRCTTLPIQTS